MKKPDLVILIAVWEFITAFFALIGMSALAFVALAPESWWYPDTPYIDGMHGWIVFGVGIGILILCVYMALGIISGIGLLKGREYGRVLGTVHGALSLPAFPVGTAIGILQMVYLMRTDVKEYFKSL
ncbi:hypothetical protein DGWBC_1621 [Dehalogenimonas sp. WBC-2]|nr:hypothetical protein DGWBC_1621 [Dehalogenimonas sp. WBC-2]